MTQSCERVGFGLRLEVIDEFLQQRPAVDFVEVIVDNWFSEGPHHHKLAKVRQDYPLTFHCVGMNLAGEDELDMAYLQRVQQLAQQFQPLHISDHLAFQAHQSRFHHDLMPFPFNEESLKRVSARIKIVQDFFQQQLLVENLSYYVCFNSSDIPEVEFFNRLFQLTNCGMLLDLNNLWVNQQNLGHSPQDFLEQLNWQQVGEVHLAGAEVMYDYWLDTHGEIIHGDVLALAQQFRKKLMGLPIVYEKDNNVTSLQDFTREVGKVREALHV